MKNMRIVFGFLTALMLLTATTAAQEDSATSPFELIQVDDDTKKRSTPAKQTLKCDPKTKLCTCIGGIKSDACETMKIFFCQFNDRTADMQCTRKKCQCTAPAEALTKKK